MNSRAINEKKIESTFMMNIHQIVQSQFTELLDSLHGLNMVQVESDTVFQAMLQHITLLFILSA